MEIERPRLLAERLHADDYEEDGTALLREGLESEQLCALRLLHRADDARSGGVYLAHLGLIARAPGLPGRLAREVKIADLQDRCLHPRVRADGWSPPYARGLALLTDHDAGRATGLRPFGRLRIANSSARRL
jgi:hypothetical protein